MLQAHAETVAVGIRPVETGLRQAVPVEQVRTVLKVGPLEALLLHHAAGVAVGVIGPELHLVVEEVPGAVQTAHPGGGDAVAATPAALAAAHASATAAHPLHHAAGEVVETAVVGIVSVQDEADLALVGEAADEGAALVARIAGIGAEGRLRVALDVMSAAGGHIPAHTVHHSLVDGQVDDRLLLSVVDAGELRLLRLLLDHFHLVDNLGRQVLGGQLRIVQEERLSVDGDLRNGLAVLRNGTVLGDLHAGQLLEQVLQHVVLRRPERGGVVLHRIFLDDDRVADGGYARGVQRLLVDLHFDGTEVHLSLDLDLFFVGLVAEQLAFEDIRAGGDLVELRLPVGGAQDILIRLGFAFLRQGNGRETHRLLIGSI